MFWRKRDAVGRRNVRGSHGKSAEVRFEQTLPRLSSCLFGERSMAEACRPTSPTPAVRTTTAVVSGMCAFQGLLLVLLTTLANESQVDISQSVDRPPSSGLLVDAFAPGRAGF